MVTNVLHTIKDANLFKGKGIKGQGRHIYLMNTGKWPF